jgi:peptide/nickel transport system substrate-binding protein
MVGHRAFRNLLLAASLLAPTLLAGAAPPAAAADLIIGRATEQSALDPMYAQFTPDVSTADNVFERVAAVGPTLALSPGLALSWRLVDPTTWELKLRPGVHWHDGSAFTAADVAFSLKRAHSIPNSPAPVASYVAAIKDTEAVDDLTLRIHTLTPAPMLLEQISQIFIIPAKLGAGVTTEDFNAGRAMIGTGPYRYKSHLPGDEVVVTANPDYWGDKAKFGTVTLKFINNDAARIAALLSGQIDVTEQIPPTDVPVLSKRPGVALFPVVSMRIVYLALDSARDQSPDITDKAGKPMDKNPLRDVRVRRALSLLINREAIVDRVLGGAGVAAAQTEPEGFGGYDAKLQPVYDPAAAKKLLAEAGYADGFGITVHGSNNRFPKDSEVTQAVGQMFSRGGLKVNAVEVLPYNVYGAQATQRKYSDFIFSYGNTTSNSLLGLSALLHTYDAQVGVGQLNRVRYSNPKLDAMIDRAGAEFDETSRNAQLVAAADEAMADGALLPLYWQKLYWAARKGFVVTPDKGERTSALFIAPEK